METIENHQYEGIGEVYRWSTTIEDGLTLICQAPPVPRIVKRILEVSSGHTDITQMLPHLSSFFQFSRPASRCALQYPSLRNAALYPNSSLRSCLVRRLVLARFHEAVHRPSVIPDLRRNIDVIIVSLPMSLHAS
jgi:hypothetical protein